jgi:U4/U6.U5 tri-snRNP-associated protein 1
MSIEDANRVRAQLGLKPLNVGSGQTKSDKQDENERDDLEGSAIPNSEVRHKPAENLTEKSHIEKMREKLQQRRQKRLVEAKLLNVKTLGESDTEDVSPFGCFVNSQVRS